MQCCFHDKKKLPYRVKWGVFTFYVRCVIALKTNDNTSPQPRTVLLEVEQYKHLLNCHYVIQRNRGFLDEYCINMRSLRHTKTRNRKGYENHVITLYSVVTWFFFYKFCLIFREFKADLIVTWLKCVAFLGYPSLAGKMGKWEKQACFSKELVLYKMRFVYYDLSSKK